MTTDTLVQVTEVTGYDVEVTQEVVAGRIVYVAHHPELRGCMSHGTTPAEALANLDEARVLYLDAAERSGVALPPPHANPSLRTLRQVRPARDERPIPVQTPWRTVQVA